MSPNSAYSDYGGKESRSSTHLTFEDLPKDPPRDGRRVTVYVNKLWEVLVPRGQGQLLRGSSLGSNILNVLATWISPLSISHLFLGLDENERASEQACTRPSCHAPGRAG